MSNLVVRMTGEEAELYRAFNRIISQQERMGGTMRKSASEAQKLEHAAKRMVESARPATEKYRESIDTLNAALRNGSISKKEASRAAVKLKQDLDSTTRSTGELTLAEQRAARAAEIASQKKAEQIRLERAAQQTYEQTRTAAERYEAQLKDLELQYQRTGMDAETYQRRLQQLQAELRETQVARAGALGGAAMQDIKNFVMGFVSVTGGITAATAALREMRQVSEQAGQRITDSITGRRELAQLAETPEHYERLIAAAERIRVAEGLSAAEAYETTFEAESAEMIDDVDLFAKMINLGFAPAASIQAVQKFQANFGGAGMGDTGAGDARALLNKIFAASAPSPVNADDIALASATAATSFASIGGGDEELMAFLSVASIPFKNADAAAERINSLASQVGRKKDRINWGDEKPLGGFALLDALPRLAEEGRLLSKSGDTQTLDEFLEESNARQGLQQFMRQREKIDKLLADVRAAEAQSGQPDDIVAGRFAILAGDKQSASVKAAQQAAEERKLAEELRYGAINEQAQALFDAIIARAENAGEGGLSILGQKAMMNSIWTIGGAEGFIDQYYDQAPTADLRESVRRAQLGAVLKRIRQGTSGLEDRLTAQGALNEATGGQYTAADFARMDTDRLATLLEQLLAETRAQNQKPPLPPPSAPNPEHGKETR